MKKAGRVVLIVAAFAFAVIPLLSQTKPQTPSPKPSFEVVSIKPSPPNLNMRGGGPRGDRLIVTGGSLRMLLQQAYARPNPTGGPGAPLQIIGGPNWIDSDLYDVSAKADCTAGPVPREQIPLMIQSMLEERFQLQAHTETRELPLYNLVVGRDGFKLKLTADQTPPPFAQSGPPPLCGPMPAPVALPAPPPPPPPGGGPAPPFNPGSLPRGAMRVMMSPTGMTMQASSASFANFVNLLQQFAGRPVIDKTDIKGLFDFRLQFSPEGISLPGAPGGFPPGPGPGIAGPGTTGGPGGVPAPSADPVPSLFTAIQELGLRLESSKGPIEVLIVDGAQKPTEN